MQKEYLEENSEIHKNNCSGQDQNSQSKKL